MLTITVDEIQRDLITYLQRVAAGETLLITQSNKPFAEIKPVINSQQARPWELAAGDFRLPDDFDAPLPDDVILDFEAA